MIDRENVIKKLESLRDICNAKSDMSIGNGKVAWAGYANAADDALVLLKEQEPTKTGHWIFESRYYDAWSNICSECGRLLTTAVDTYANYCSNCGAKMTGGDSIGSEIPNS